MLLRSEVKLTHVVKVILTFDDLSTKEDILSIGDTKTITFAEKGELIVAKGVIENMIVPPDGGEIYIFMDCSDKYESSKYKFSTGAIRDMDVTPIDQAGLTVVVDDKTVRHYVSTTVEYGGATNIKALFDISAKDIDTRTLKDILNQVTPVDAPNGEVQLEFAVDRGKFKYNKVDKYGFTSKWDGGVVPPPTQESLKETSGTMVFYPTAFKVSYRLTEEDTEWLEGTTLPVKDGTTIITLGDQLVNVLGVDADRLPREYGYLYRFEPVYSDKVLKIRLDMYEDITLVGTEYFFLTYENTIRPEDIVMEANEIELTVGETKLLKGRVVPEEAPVPDLLYTSNNNAVATVGLKTGLVTAIAPGNTIVVVTAADANTITKKFYISVTEVGPTPTFTTTVDVNPVALAEGTTTPVVVSYDIPDVDELKATTGDTNIATATVVDSTHLTVAGVNDGETIVTLVAVKEGYQNSTLVVNIKVAPVYSVDTNKTDVSLVYGSGTTDEVTLTYNGYDDMNVVTVTAVPVDDTIVTPVVSEDKAKVTFTALKAGTTKVNITVSKTGFTDVVKEVTATVLPASFTLEATDVTLVSGTTSNVETAFTGVTEVDTLAATTADEAIATVEVVDKVVKVTAVSVNNATTTCTITADKANYTQATKTINVNVQKKEDIAITLADINMVKDAAATDVSFTTNCDAVDSFTVVSSNTAVVTAVYKEGNTFTLTPIADTVGEANITITAQKAGYNEGSTIVKCIVTGQFTATLEDQTLVMTDAPKEVPVTLTGLTTGEYPDTITFEEATTPDIVTVTGNAEGKVTITPVGVGTTIISMIAAKANYNNADLVFNVTVSAGTFTASTEAQNISLATGVVTAPITLTGLGDTAVSNITFGEFSTADIATVVASETLDGLVITPNNVGTTSIPVTVSAVGFEDATFTCEITVVA